MLQNLVPSLIRTYVPIALTVFFGWLASFGITVDDTAKAAAATGVGAAVSGLYYLAVRIAEQKIPMVGKLLGTAKQPVYDITTLPPAPAAKPSPALSAPVTSPSAPMTPETPDAGDAAAP